MRKTLSVALVLAAALAGAAYAQSPKDGFYFAEEAAFARDGWKHQAILEVKGGKIVSAKYNAVNVLGMPDKKTAAKEGKYVMKAKLGEWDVQSARVEAELVKLGDPSKIKVKPNGTTDAVSGASIIVKNFLDLVPKALAAGPVAKGSYGKDGWFFAKAASPDSTGYFPTALVTIVNGSIVSAVSDAIPKKGGPTKYVAAISGKYVMKAKQGEWHIQADRMAKSLVKAQNPGKIALKSNGTTDAVSGVSVIVGDFLKVAAEALKGAK